MLPPAGPARLPDRFTLPGEVLRFHECCGGAVLFVGADFPWHVGVPDRVVPASPRLLTPEMAARVADEHPDDLSNGCFVIADGGRESSMDPTIVVDLQPTGWGAAMWRSGRRTAWWVRCPSSH